jgi:hypothetical protein
MSVDRRLLNWGVFLVLLGGIPLAVAQGWIPRDAVAQAWELWPLILIGAGIGLILSRTPFQAIGGIIVAGTFGVILGAIVAVGFGGISIGDLGCGSASPDAPQVLSETGTFEGGTGRVVLAANCAAVTVATGAGASWGVDVRGTDSARPTVRQTAGGLEVRSPEGPATFPLSSKRSTWRVDLGTDPRLDLEMSLNAGEAALDLRGATIGRLGFDGNAIGNSRLDLSAATVDRIDVSVNAASIAILLPAADSLQGTVEGNAASVGICVPAGVGLRLLVDENITASNNFDEQGLVKRGNAWESPDYATAATQTELRTIGAAVSYELNPEDGCR